MLIYIPSRNILTIIAQFQNKCLAFCDQEIGPEDCNCCLNKQFYQINAMQNFLAAFHPCQYFYRKTIWLVAEILNDSFMHWEKKLLALIIFYVIEEFRIHIVTQGLKYLRASWMVVFARHWRGMFSICQTSKNKDYSSVLPVCTMADMQITFDDVWHCCVPTNL